VVYNWLIIELSEQADQASTPELEAAIVEIFGDDIEYFIPRYHEEMGSYTSTNILFEGYIFVKDSNEVRSNISRIKESRFLQGALRSKSTGRIATATANEIKGMKKKLSDSVKKKFDVGAKVKINEGIFENLHGEIVSVEEGGRIANVCIKCLSREILAPIPTTCIELSTENL
jgi:transcription antitermination factor NusG